MFPMRLFQLPMSRPKHPSCDGAVRSDIVRGLPSLLLHYFNNKDMEYI